MSLNHRLMYTGSTDGLAKCWVTEHGDNTVTYKGHSLSVTVVKFYKGLGKVSNIVLTRNTGEVIGGIRILSFVTLRDGQRVHGAILPYDSVKACSDQFCIDKEIPALCLLVLRKITICM